MNIREQEYLLELDRFRSITQAAEALHITQPALSIFLTKLEKSQGAPLFERVGKSLVPTPVGEAYIYYARQIAALRNDYELEKAELIRGTRGRLNIGGLPMRNINLMPRVLGAFKEMHPEIDTFLFSRHHDELVEMLLSGELDLILTNRSVDYPGLHREPVQQDKLLLVLPAGHPAEQLAKSIPGLEYPRLNLEDLAEETFYVPLNGQTLRSYIDQAMAACPGVDFRIHEVEYIELCSQLAAEGLGAAFTMESYARHFYYDKEVRYYLTEDTSQGPIWNIFHRSSTAVPAYMTDFVDLLKEKI